MIAPTLLVRVLLRLGFALALGLALGLTALASRLLPCLARQLVELSSVLCNTLLEAVLLADLSGKLREDLLVRRTRKNGNGRRRHSGRCGC